MKKLLAAPLSLFLMGAAQTYPPIGGSFKIEIQLDTDKNYPENTTITWVRTTIINDSQIDEIFVAMSYAFWESWKSDNPLVTTVDIGAMHNFPRAKILKSGQSYTWKVPLHIKGCVTFKLGFNPDIDPEFRPDLIPRNIEQQIFWSNELTAGQCEKPQV